MNQYSSFRDFYPFYLGEHSNLTCRRLHFAGTTGVVIVAILVLAQVLPLVWLWAIPVLGMASPGLDISSSKKIGPPLSNIPSTHCLATG